MESGTLPPDDEALLAELRDVIGRLDPIPESVRVAARLALEWRTLDAELAELVHDTAIDAPVLALRGAVAPRALTFEAPDLTIEVEAEAAAEPGELRLVGQLVPPQRAEVAVRHGDDLVAVHVDERGRFAACGIATGPVSLRCRLDGPSGAGRLVETAWLTI